MTIVAIGQFYPGLDKKSNFEVVAALVREASSRQAKVIALPEYSLFCAPSMDDRFVDSAESLDGPFVTALQTLARETDITIVCGFNEIAEPGHRISNTLVAVGNDGNLVAVYRKLHLFDAFGYKESDKVRPGDIEAPQLFDVDGLKYGLQTCYDVRFPEVTRRIVDAGADVLLLPAAWVPGPLKEDHWTTLIRARAIENTIYVAASDQSAPGGAGGSIIVDPMGVVIAGLGETTGISTAQVTATRIAGVRQANPALELRRFAVT
ncbi:carbon-nitrogen hydrolase family protein [Rhodococcus erythropolis]